jgi:hypothetical protein
MNQMTAERLGRNAVHILDFWVLRRSCSAAVLQSLTLAVVGRLN